VRTCSTLLEVGVRLALAQEPSANAVAVAPPMAHTAIAHREAVSVSSDVYRAWATAIASTPARADVSRGGQVWTPLWGRHAPAQGVLRGGPRQTTYRQAPDGGTGVQVGVQARRDYGAGTCPRIPRTLSSGRLLESSPAASRNAGAESSSKRLDQPELQAVISR
jgi:hypothetical protein